MKKIITILLLTGLSVWPVLAGTSLADSLRNRLSYESTDTGRVMLYNRIAREIGNTAMLTATSDRVLHYNIAIQYADSGLILAQKSAFRKGEAELYRTMGAMYFYLNDFGVSISNYEKALEIATEVNDEYGKAALIYNIALVYLKQDNFLQSLKYLFAVLPYWEKMGLKQQLETTNSYIALVFNYVEEYDLSVEFSQKAMSLAYDLKDTDRVAALYDIIAANYLLIGDTLSSIDAYEKSIQLYHSIDNIRSKARVILNYIDNIKSLPIDKKRQLLVSVLHYFEQYDPEHNFLATVYKEMGDIFQSINKPDSVWYYMDKAINQALLSGHAGTVCYIYLAAAQLSLSNQGLLQAEKYFNVALRHNKQVRSVTVEKDCYDGLVELYLQKGDDRKAFELKCKAIHFQDSVTVSENKHQMELLQMQHEIREYQEWQETDWKIKAEDQQSMIKRRQRDIAFILSAVCFLIILLLIVIRNQRITRNNNRKLQEQHDEILQIQDELYKSNHELNQYKEYLEEMVRQQIARQTDKDQQIRNINDNIPGFIFRKVTKPDGLTYVSYISNKVEQLIGISADKIIKKKENLLTMMGNDSIVNELEEKEKECIRTMSPFTFEHHFVKEHHLIWIYYYSLPHPEENGNITWDGFVIDITKQKEVEISLEKAKEQAEESDRLKSGFLSNISHEVRTPMNAILGFISFIEQENLPKKIRDKYIRIVQENIDQLLHLINNIIDISKLDVHQKMVFPAQFSLHPLMEEVRQYWCHHNKLSALDIILDDSRFIQPDTLFNDSERLKQVLGNLIENALKYTDKGYIRFGYQPADDPSELLFFVEDTGVGIPRDQHDVIFEYFRQGNDTDHIMYRTGTGLGLSIFKGLVEQMGGRIFVESVEGQGSTFYFTIKRKLK